MYSNVNRIRENPFAASAVEAEKACRATLENTLMRFSQISGQLEESYQFLEDQVTVLQHELDSMEVQRSRDLREKEHIARRLQNVLDVLPGGLVILDAQGIICEANPAALELLGEPLVGSLWRQVITRCFAPRVDDGHEVSLKDSRRLSISTRSLEGEPGQVILLTDLTETRRLQEQVARSERLSVLGHMMASLAHQIRTPLSSALLYAGQLEDSERLTPAQRRQFAVKLKDRLHALEHQVRDMLLFAKGELPITDRIAPQELFYCIQAAAEAATRNHRVRWIMAPSFTGDLLCRSDTLVGAVINLLNNALQAGGSEIRLKVHLYQHGDSLRLSVTDNGPGIPDESLERLAEPFYTTKQTGTGLGLAVARAVVKAHRGQMRIRSRAQRGTSVCVSLPLVPTGKRGRS